MKFIHPHDTYPLSYILQGVAGIVSERLGLPPGLMDPTGGSVLTAVRGANFMQSMPGIPPLSLNSISSSLASSISVATDTINSMTNTLPTLSSERSSSRNSYSPAMSDSGISVDAASTSSSSTQPLVNLANFSKLGGTNISVNPQGMLNNCLSCYFTIFP